MIRPEEKSGPTPVCRSLHRSNEYYLSGRSSSRISIIEPCVHLVQRDSAGRGSESRAEESDRTLGQRRRVSDGGTNEPPYIPQLYHKHRAERTPRADGYLMQKARRAAVCETSSISLIIYLCQSAQPYSYR